MVVAQGETCATNVVPPYTATASLAVRGVCLGTIFLVRLEMSVVNPANGFKKKTKKIGGTDYKKKYRTVFPQFWPLDA